MFNYTIPDLNIPVQKEYKIIKTSIVLTSILEREINESINDGFKIERVDIINNEYIVWLYRLIDKAPQDPPEEDPETILKYIDKIKSYCSGRGCSDCAFELEKSRCKLYEVLEK